MNVQAKTHLLRLAVSLSFVLALVNHLLPPKAFPATQLLFDYDLGIARRGLAGEVLGWFTGARVSVSEIHVAAAAVTLVGAFAFYAFLGRSLRDRTSALLLMILAFNSFAFASFIGATGYLDALLLGLAVLALSVPAQGVVGPVLRVAFCLLGVLVHENMLPYFTVLVALDTWLGRGATRRAWAVAAAPVACAALGVAFLAVFAEFTPAGAQAFAAHLADKAGFVLDPTSSDVAGRTITENFALMADLRLTTRYWFWVLFDGVPLFAMSLWLIWISLNVAGERADRWTRLFLIAAVVAPLSLNIVAFDAVRFGTASVLAGFMAIVILIRRLDGAAERLEGALSWPLFAVVLVLNANIFTIQINMGEGHMSQFPWVLIRQLDWMAP